LVHVRNQFAFFRSVTKKRHVHNTSKMSPTLLGTLNFLLFFGWSISAPGNPSPYRYLQPDNSETPLIWIHGDHFYNWMSDEKGYTIVKDELGWYTYAVKAKDGDIISSGVPIGSKNPKKLGILPGMLHAEHKRPMYGMLQDSNLSIEHRSLFQIPENAISGFNGTKSKPCRLRGIVFLVKFSDHAKRILPSQQEYDILFNNNGPDSKNAPTGSVSDVFSENSYQTFVLESYVTPWIKIARTEAQTVDGNMGMNKPGTKLSWTRAITKFAKTNIVDLKTFDVNKDGQFDCVVILHSGSAAETSGIDCENGKDAKQRIWSHATSSNIYTTSDGLTKVNRYYVASALFGVCPPGGKGTKWDIARIAVIAHECAHFLGLPDLYDTIGGQGVGTYDLMGKFRTYFTLFSNTYS
jgi:M6 family metalloprotease-like protein